MSDRESYAPPPPAHPRARRLPRAGRLRARRGRFSPRYRSFIGFLKLVLPSFAVILVVLVAVWPQVQPRSNKLPLGFASMNPEELDDLSMINARYTGIDGRNQPFTVIADVAREVSPESSAIALESPKADVTLGDGTWLALTAKDGIFRREQQVMELSGDVNMFHDAGYEFRTATAQVDLAEGTAFGFDPVAGHGPFGTIKSEGFLVLDRGQRIIFTGAARLVLYPDIERAQP